MIQHTIEELHDLFKNQKVNPTEYYNELFKEIEIQQERLNAFVTITKDEALKSLSEASFNTLLSGIPYVLKDNYNTKDILTTASSRMLDDYVPDRKHVV